MKYKVFLDSDFTNAINKVKNSPLYGMKAKDKFQCLCLIKELMEKSDTAHETKNKLLEEYGTLSEDKRGYIFEPESKKEEFVEQLNDFMGQDFDLKLEGKIKIPVEMIEQDDASKVVFSVGEMIATSDIFDFE